MYNNIIIIITYIKRLLFIYIIVLELVFILLYFKLILINKS